MSDLKIDIDRLIEIVSGGGIVKTGVDIYNKERLLLLEKDVLVKNINILLHIKQSGINSIPISISQDGGIWDKDGKKVLSKNYLKEVSDSSTKISLREVDRQINEIKKLKQEAAQIHDTAKKNIKKVLNDIQDQDGVFSIKEVEDTVTTIFSFLEKNEHSFSYLAKEIFSYDDYLFNHSVNVCTLGTAVLKKFNDQFSQMINNYLSGLAIEEGGINEGKEHKNGFTYLQAEEIQDISTGFFLHDIGKVLLPERILNKSSRLTDGEYEEIKTHSYLKGLQILKRNGIDNIYIRNIVTHHHVALFAGESNAYPNEKLPIEIPAYVKICKLVDIFDAITSKRSYKEAANPVVAVTEIFRKYANHDQFLQIILHSFVKVVGVYPPGSVVQLQNGQLAYIVDSSGPIIIPFTDRLGNTLNTPQDPVNLSEIRLKSSGFDIDRRKPLISPTEYYKVLPAFLRES
ncbi:MAG: HD domain-containing protein [Candidatus Delongbacteria bacterium]|nr:HD domain-containing protein [Candidatus Delongbacteria bacterium]